MYASSFILPLRRVETILQRILERRTYHRGDGLLASTDEAMATLEDVGELSSVAVPNVSVEAHTPTQGDRAVAELISTRIDGGFGAELDAASIERAKLEGRIDEYERADAVVVPVGDGMPDVRNWWILAELLVEWLDELAAGYHRAKRRAEGTASRPIVSSFRALAEMLGCLRDTIERCRSLGGYLVATVRRSGGRLLDTVERFTTSLVVKNDA